MFDVAKSNPSECRHSTETPWALIGHLVEINGFGGRRELGLFQSQCVSCERFENRVVLEVSNYPQDLDDEGHIVTHY